MTNNKIYLLCRDLGKTTEGTNDLRAIKALNPCFSDGDMILVLNERGMPVRMIQDEEVSE